MPDGPRKQSKVRVSVHAPGGAHHEGPATVTLSASGTRTTLERPKGSLLFEGSVAPGTYTLSARAGDLRAPGRPLEVPRGQTTASVYLGEKSWPAYRAGQNVVPFEPRDELIAVVFETRRPDARQAHALIDRLTSELPIRPFDIGGGGELPFTAADGAIWILQLGEPRALEGIAARIRELLETDVRIGVPVNLEPGSVRVIDNRFVIRFRDHLKPDDIAELADKAGARILRPLIQAGNARVIEFLRGDYRSHLRTVEGWYDADLLVYGEPDVMSELVDDQFPALPPDDPEWANQANLTLQDVDDAWQFLNGLDANLTLGSPNVHIATVDRGVQITHPDVGGNLTDGTPQIAQCYDFVDFQPCTAPGYTTDGDHGMGVYGIVAARTNNGTGVAGIAPNTHQIGIKRSGAGGVTYADSLLWAAGFTTGNPTAGWPAEPISPGADIISCSHGDDGAALTGLMDDTLRYLATYGRNGRGTVVVYSTGNTNSLITGYRVWAAHPRTIAVANSLAPDVNGVERRADDSNFGPEVDVCARGNGSRSLNDTGGTRTFNQTSAATPAVAAVAGLMLSAEPSLTWINVRDLLRDNAVQIDPANTDPVGQWSGGFSQWYGFGRIDADDSVQAADAFDLASVNLLIRDNLGDEGLVVPSGGTWWRSPDIWVVTSDPTGTAAPAYAVAPPHEPAISGQDNWVRVRVRNVGTDPSSDFWVRLYLTHFAGTEFRYPADYIPSGNPGDPIPSPLVQGTYLIGEQAVTALAAAGGTVTLDFLWPAALVPPEIVNGTKWHPCLLAETSPHTGPAPSGDRAFDRTSIGQRNITIDYSDDDRTEEATGVIGHEEDDAREKRISVHRGRLPKGARLWVRFPDRRVEKAVLTRLRRSPEGEAGRVVVEERHGKRIFRLAAGSRLELVVPMVSGPMTPVVIGAHVPSRTRRGSYELPLVERDMDGHARGAFALELEVR